MLKSQLMKSNLIPDENRVNAKGEFVFAHDYRATVLVAEICTNHHEHST
jgi:hypothetical protein